MTSLQACCALRRLKRIDQQHRDRHGTDAAGYGCDETGDLPHAGEGTAALIRGARFVPIPGMGHDLPPATWPKIGDELERVRDRVS
mgnify:CR=1 FL=1